MSENILISEDEELNKLLLQGCFLHVSAVLKSEEMYNNKSLGMPKKAEEDKESIDNFMNAVNAIIEIASKKADANYVRKFIGFN